MSHTHLHYITRMRIAKSERSMYVQKHSDLSEIQVSSIFSSDAIRIGAVINNISNANVSFISTFSHWHFSRNKPLRQKPIPPVIRKRTSKVKKFLEFVHRAHIITIIQSTTSTHPQAQSHTNTHAHQPHSIYKSTVIRSKPEENINDRQFVRFKRSNSRETLKMSEPSRPIDGSCMA